MTSESNMYEAHDNPDGRMPAGGHEPDAVPARAVVWTAIGLMLGLVLALALAYATFELLAEHDKPPATEVTAAPPRAVPAPQLNPDQQRTLQALRHAEQAILGSYEWIDGQQGIARIPIDRAMEILAEKGLDSASASEEQHHESR
jgi:hypothetical protein